MDAIRNVLGNYTQIVEQVVLGEGGWRTEEALAAAFELGRSLVGSNATPDQIANLHHEAVRQFAARHGAMHLDQLADRITLPLLELTMAHGMLFREQMEQRYLSQVAARLEQSSRLEAVGTLAAGIAHDFNNLLGSIVGYTEMTQDAVAEQASCRENLRQILVACARANNLVDRLLAFARQKPSTPVAQNLGEQIGEVVTILAPLLSAGIRLDFDNSLPDAVVLADAGQIQQILMNLCINAGEAMDGGGHIRIVLGSAATQAKAPREHRSGACISVIDDGVGMPPEVQAHVFDPFFTTKAPQGSGLGLAVTHGIVTQLGGAITLASRSAGPHTGTEFHIYLPLAPGPAEGGRTHEESRIGTHTDR